MESERLGIKSQLHNLLAVQHWENDVTNLILHRSSDRINLNNIDIYQKTWCLIRIQCSVCSLPQDQWFSTTADLHPRWHLALLRDFLIVRTRHVLLARDAARHPIMHRTFPQKKNLSKISKVLLLRNPAPECDSNIFIFISSLHCVWQ